MHAQLNDPKRIKPGPILLILAGLLTFLAVLFTISQPQTAQAGGGDLASATTKYPQIANTRLDTCSLCHTSSIPGLNPYGAAYSTNGRNVAAFGLIESADSDGDGFTNLQELNALTFPGNAGDHPAAAPTTTQVPPTATSVPPTATGVPPTVTSPAQTATVIPPTTTSVPPTATSISPTSTSVAPTATSTSANPYPPPPEATPTNSNPYPAPATPTTLPTKTVVPTEPLPQPTETATLPPQPTPTPIQPTPAPTHPKPTPTQPSETPPANHGLQLAPVADASVSADSRNTNYGSNLSLKTVDDPRSVSYLRFRIPELENDRQISKAILHLYVNSASGSGFTVRRVSGEAWSESQITYANAPMPGESIASSGRPATGHWIAVDVTALIRNEAGSYSLALLARQGAWNSFASRESGEHAPQLVLTLGDDHEEKGDD
ncbi:MAG: DNRLRE domain-containing protein [Anaerolineaceae bacterium]|nr:DNRLRE domain-containing protein [Anaerolineaceae bacterium]